MSAVGKVKTGHIHAGFYQFFQNAGLICGRSKGTDDFCFSKQSNPSSYIYISVCDCSKAGSGVVLGKRSFLLIALRDGIGKLP